MGNSAPQQQSSINYDWQWISNDNGLELYKNKLNGLVAQKRLIELDNRYSLEGERNIYSYRQNNTDGLVRTYQAEPLSQDGDQGLCRCGNKTRIQVYSERIPYRLSQLPQLTFPQSLYLLRESLNSYEIIYQKMGPLNINQQLIGIDSEGQAKVWVNQNWALNHPSHEMPRLKSTQKIDYSQVSPEYRDESQMVANIFNVIEEKTQQGRFPQPFSSNMRQKNTFRDAKKYLSQYSTQQFRGYIPTYLVKDRVSSSPGAPRPQESSAIPSMSFPPQNLVSSRVKTTTTTRVETYQQNYSNGHPVGVTRPESQKLLAPGAPSSSFSTESYLRPGVYQSIPQYPTNQNYSNRQSQQPAYSSFNPPLASNHAATVGKKYEYQPFQSVAQSEYIKSGEYKSTSPPQPQFQHSETITTRKQDTPFPVYASGGSYSIQPVSHQFPKAPTFTGNDSWRPSIATDNEYTYRTFTTEMRASRTIETTGPNAGGDPKKPWELDFKQFQFEQPRPYTASNTSNPVQYSEHRVTTIEQPGKEPLRFQTFSKGTNLENKPLSFGSNVKPESPHYRLNNMFEEVGLSGKQADEVRRAVQEGAGEVAM